MSETEHPFALAAEERLRSRKSVSKLFNEGRSGFSYPLRYLWIEQESAESSSVPASVLFNVPKRFHRRANKRNLLRRRVKEAYRVQKSVLVNSEERAPLHVALVYSTKESLSYAQIHRAVGKILELIKNERAKAKEQQQPTAND